MVNLLQMYSGVVGGVSKWLWMKLAVRVVCFGFTCCLCALLSVILVVALRQPSYRPSDDHFSFEQRLIFHEIHTTAPTTAGATTEATTEPRTERPTAINPAIRVLSAYYEERPSMLGPSVLIIGYQDKSYNESLNCFAVFPDESVRCSPVETRAIDQCNRFAKRGYMSETFYTCRLWLESGSPITIPRTVALSHNSSCDLLVSASVSVSWRPKDNESASGSRPFGVCLQTPIYKLRSVQVVVDFIEMSRLLGAETFTLYVINVGTSVDRRVLAQLKQAYAEEGILEVVELQGVFEMERPLHYYGELRAINDCLYRNMYRSSYLVFQDLDEMIVPRKHQTWLEAIQEMDPNSAKSGYVFKNMYMTATKPSTLIKYVRYQQQCKQMKMPLYLRNLDRANCDYPHFQRSKYIARPELIHDLDIHGICTPVKGYWQYYVPGDIGGNFHYRFRTDSTCQSPTTELDLKMLNYSSALLNSVTRKICP